ncbi:hypothetical protein OG819_12495 [Streptomyces sp. NBC_01549]|uniref:hypothetical protein n=1 Tax=Streptomyces sp. NBC_01549 TaxID=2975874 RepID=UPI00225AB5BD|nr:hypothetical protein [Streptomyces sp. NBC_01549]MCX4590548.1 hypothetical protein [Streptomyces sp. NBC_01549]
MKRHRKFPRPSAEAERLREVFTEAAYDVTPSAVPLAAIERAGLRRKRRRTAAVAGSACALLVVPLAVVALREAVSSGAGDERAASPSGLPMTTVRVVTAGERVEVAHGIKIWLTEDGEHWSSPAGSGPRFTSVKAGATDPSEPGVTVRQEGAGDLGYFLSGLYRGENEAARVEVGTTSGQIAGTALTLAGDPHWGVWYAMVNTTKSIAPGTSVDVTRRITVYDSAGGVIASTGAAR